MESSVIRVPQLASAVRVPPQDPSGELLSHCASVQLCPMYSEAIHSFEPSTTAAP